MEPKKDLPQIAFEKILKEADALRISEKALEVFTEKTEKYIQEVANASRKYALHAGRKTIMTEDIDLAIKEFSK